jgi:hypothetical protein
MNKEEVLAAVSRNGYALRDAPPALQADKEVVLAAVLQRPGALLYASPGLQADKEVVLAAVSQQGNTLMSASPALKADKEVVLTAVSNNGSALQDASPALKADPEVVLAAISQNLRALRFTDPALRGNPEFLWRASKIGYTPTAREQALIQQYIASRKATVMPLLATTRRAPADMDAARKQAAFARLNAHGPIFGKIFRTEIAAHAGVSGGRRRKTKRRKRK